MSLTIKEVQHPELGLIKLRKIRTAKHVRLRLPPKGGVLVTMPFYMPFQAGLNYALKQRDWIEKHQTTTRTFKSGERIGRSHSFSFQPADVASVQTRRTSMHLVVKYPPHLSETSPEVQQAAHEIAVRALRYEAAEILPMRLNQLAREYGFAYEECLLRQLTARWGSCTNKKIITLNIFLMQLPDHLIDYVLLHELTHTEHLNHSHSFWTRLERAIPDAKQRRLAIKSYNPAL